MVMGDTKQKNRLRLKYWITIVRECFAIIGVIVAITTLLFNFFPYFMRDYTKRANAGDQNAQLYLANYYYDVGDYPNSLYWYKAASLNNGRGQDVAYNNLAYLYYNNFVPENFTTSNSTYYDTIYDLLNRGRELGSKTAEDNLTNFLLECDSVFFQNQEAVKALLEIKPDDKYIYKETICGANYVPINSDVLRYVTVGSDYIIDGTQGMWIYNYAIYMNLDWEYDRTESFPVELASDLKSTPAFAYVCVSESSEIADQETGEEQKVIKYDIYKSLKWRYEGRRTFENVMENSEEILYDLSTSGITADIDSGEPKISYTYDIYKRINSSSNTQLQNEIETIIKYDISVKSYK